MEPDDLIGQGRAFEAEGKLDEAVQAYDAAVQAAPTAPAPLLRRALVRVRQHDCPKALPDLEAFARLSPASGRSGADWDDALLQLAICRRDVRGTVVLTTAQEARCRIDDGAPRAVTVAAGLSLELDPGEHLIDCSASGLVYFRQFVLAPKERLALAAQFEAVGPDGARRRVVTSTPGASGSQEDPGKLTDRQKPVEAHEKPPAQPEPPRFVEFSVGGGFGATRGAAGLSLGLRVANVAVSVGSGFFPLGAELSFLFRPGETSPYVSVGYMRLAPGLLGGGSIELGHEAFAVVGVEVRPFAHLAVRLGAGGAYLSTEHNAGPLTFDAAVFWLP